MKLLLINLFITLAFWSCTKTEGVGGQASVKGKIYVKEFNSSFTQQIDEYYGMEENVYLIYGNNTVYDDDMKTNFDGSFEFKYLNKGSYRIFVYSKDSTFTVAGGKEPIFIDFEITDKKEAVDLGDITIIN